MPNNEPKFLVAIIGAGPAGIFASRELANHNAHVVLINRDIKPGGLAEYGIYPTKHRMKEGLRAQFRQIMAIDGIEYFGNVIVGEKAAIHLSELRGFGFQAILVTAGAQATKWLGLPGENLEGVYHAKDLVYHYNMLPPYSQRQFKIGRRVAIIGAGNVMLDIAHYLSTVKGVEEILPIIRRGPGEIKFTRVELEYIAKLVDFSDLQTELERVAPLMESLGQNPADFQAFVNTALVRSAEVDSQAHFRMRFLVSPTQMIADEHGRVKGLEVEENTLVMANDEVKARGLGTHQILNVDTVIYAIGDRVDDSFGLPVKGSEFVKAQNPRFPVEGVSYEVYDPQADCPMDGIFVAGWSRKASDGLVGVARKDGINGARAVIQYLQTLQPLKKLPLNEIQRRLCQTSCPLITKVELAQLEAIERQRAQELGLPEYKFKSNQEMLEAVGLLPVAASGTEVSRR